jgi:hypothetical protein
VRSVLIEDGARLNMEGPIDREDIIFTGVTH